jgi:3-deoxy-D-manno-octulosonic-acid transferase
VISPRSYHRLTSVLRPAAVLLLRWRRRRGKEDPERWRERQGIAGASRPPGPLLWMHAASVGEATAAIVLVERIRQTRPAIGILVTTGTVASARLLDRRLPPGARHQFAPLDLPGWIARFLDHWRPDFAVWVESELWPNLVLATRSRGIPMALISGRLSTRSYRRWQTCRGLIRAVLGAFVLCMAQDENQAGRLRRLGAGHAEAVGDLKAAASPLPIDRSERDQMHREIGARPLWLAASTHAGEEVVAAAVHLRLAPKHPRLLTLIVPRHPDRGAAIAAMLEDRGLRVARRALGHPLAEETDVYLADTIGELGLFYSLAGIAFVGGSLVNKGGHNPFEPARLGCAVLHGPHMRNCAAMAAVLAAEGATGVAADADELARAVSDLLSDPRLQAERAAAGGRAAAAGAAVLEEVADRLAPWLDRLAAAAEVGTEGAAGPRFAVRA